MVNRIVPRALVLSALLAVRAASADDAPPADAAGKASAVAPERERLRVHHAPVYASHQRRPLTIGIGLEHPELAKQVVLVYRHGEKTEEVPFSRSASPDQPYAVAVPEEHVAEPFAYAIEAVGTDDKRSAVFASRQDLHPVKLTRDEAAMQEDASLLSVGGRRSVFIGRGEYVRFGTSSATVTAPAGGLETRNEADYYYRAEGEYTYRLFNNVVTEIGIRGGAVRGHSVVEGERNPDNFDVGLNYGSPRVRIRLDDAIHVDAEITTSVTEKGFSGGAGGAILIGDPYGTKLVLGGEGVSVFGVRGFTRLDVPLGRRVIQGSTVEVTNMPHASRAGVRLLADVGIDLGAGFLLSLRGGYQARSFDSGGPTIGGHAQYAF
jgi:hypothetical protein